MQRTLTVPKLLLLLSSKAMKTGFVRTLFFIGLLSIVFTYLSFVNIIEDPKTSSLLKIDLIILLTLVFLLGKRVISTLVIHKKNLDASRLHMKLVALFSAVSLAPAIFMALFSLFFFHYGVQSWFSEQVKTAVLESNSIAESYLHEHQNTIRADILAMANDLDRQYDVFSENETALKQMINTQTFYRNLSDAVIFDKDFKVLSSSGVETIDLSHVDSFSLEYANSGEIVVINSSEEENVQALVKLDNFLGHYLLVGRGVDATVLARVEQTREASKKYTSLESELSGIRFTLIAMYIAISGFLVIISIWVALHIAKSFLFPIEELVTASNRIRSGDLDVKLDRDTGVYEFDQLNQSYNRMAIQLSKQRSKLVSANRKIDERRIFIETVLGGVSSGVISVDNKGVIKLYNSSAQSILVSNEDESISNKSIISFIPEMKKILKQIEKSNTNEDGVFEIEMPFIDKNGNKKDLLLSAVPEIWEKKNIGVIITFDDITNLKSAQRTAAWSDVARRIAHEIKNPLTPIQLSADRLRKRFLKNIPAKEQEIFETCIETISKHVDDIGAMITEFSSFARMPEPKIKKINLSSITKQCTVLHQQGQDKIDIKLMGALSEKKDIFVNADEQLVRQAFINILQNAIESIVENRTGKNSISIWLEPHNTKLYLIIKDTGAGFPEEIEKEKILDPYVTYKKNGTGLGLAIVKKIMNDHNGEIVLGEQDWMKKLKNWAYISKKDTGAIVSLAFATIKNNKN